MMGFKAIPAAVKPPAAKGVSEQWWDLKPEGSTSMLLPGKR